MKKVTAYANANIALVKYWGKSDSLLNIPAVSSLSMTLDNIGTTLTIFPSPHDHHTLSRQGQAFSLQAQTRLASFLELVRKRYAFQGFLSVKSASHVPFGAGLASSAAFFAALSFALNSYFAWGLDLKELSKLARLGSGSAARSLLPGFVGLYGGNIHHDQAHAFVLSSKLELGMVIAILNTQEKTISSRDAMNHSKESSPFYQAFVDTAERDFQGASAALKTGHFAELGAIMEHSTLKMHATMWAAQPALNYLSDKTLSVIDFVYKLRANHGPIAFFTMDAGPNVKILCEAQNSKLISRGLSELNLCEDIRLSKPGQGARLVSEHLL